MHNTCSHCENWWPRGNRGHVCDTLFRALYEYNPELLTIKPPPEFGCIFFEPRVEVDKHCNNCKHWQHTDVALTVTWSGCSARSHEREVLMTRESHYCDKWEARP